MLILAEAFLGYHFIQKAPVSDATPASAPAMDTVAAPVAVHAPVPVSTDLTPSYDPLAIPQAKPHLGTTAKTPVDHGHHSMDDLVNGN